MLLSAGLPLWEPFAINRLRASVSASNPPAAVVSCQVRRVLSAAAAAMLAPHALLLLQLAPHAGKCPRGRSAHPILLPGPGRVGTASPCGWPCIVPRAQRSRFSLRGQHLRLLGHPPRAARGVGGLGWKEGAALCPCSHSRGRGPCPSSAVHQAHTVRASSLSVPVAVLLPCCGGGLKEGNAPCETTWLHCLFFFPPCLWAFHLPCVPVSPPSCSAAGARSAGVFAEQALLSQGCPCPVKLGCCSFCPFPAPFPCWCCLGGPAQQCPAPAVDGSFVLTLIHQARCGWRLIFPA